MAAPLITAIVSVYAAERFLRGCLDDLLAQTIADRLEILVVDACSPEHEAAIVREYQRRHPELRYVRTQARENSSCSFNRAIGMARGKYLTTANADDRHRADFCERMVAALETNRGVGIVYADSLITRRENETFADNTAAARQAWPDYTHATALSCCLFGAQPVWRRDVHQAVGVFDPTLERCNDHDMFLRIAWRFGAAHVRETLGLFLARRDSVSGADHRQDTLAEVLHVLRRYRAAMPLETVFPTLREFGDDPMARAAALVEFGNLCARGPYTDARLALDCWRRAAEVPLAGADAALVRTAFANNSGAVLACAGAGEEAERAWRFSAALPATAGNVQLVRDAAVRGVRPCLSEMRFFELPHPVVAGSRRTRGIEFDANGAPRWSEWREQVPWDVFDGPDGIPLAPAAAPSSVAPASREHVLFVMYGWADSGGGTMLPRQAAKDLAARGVRVSVVYAAARPRPGSPPYAVVRAHEDGVALHAICNRPSLFMDLARPEREVDDPELRRVFERLLDELEPDVVHFWNLHSLGMSLPAACKARGLPTVLSSNNYWPICPRLYLASERLQLCLGPSHDGRRCESCLDQRGTAAGHAARRRASLTMLNGAVDVHLATSHRVRDLFVRNGADAQRIRVLLQQPPASDAIWARAGCRRTVVERLQRPLRVGFVGSCMPHKGVHVLAAALQLLPAGAVHAFAFGDAGGEYLQLLRRVDARRALHVHGAYQQQHLPELLSKLDVVVVPSVWDDCAPLVVAEALAARAPVVGSRIGGIPDFVRDGVDGLLFTPGDAGELARCLDAFVQEPTLLGRMQRAIAPPRGFGAYVDDLRGVYAELSRTCSAAAT